VVDSYTHNSPDQTQTLHPESLRSIRCSTKQTHKAVKDRDLNVQTDRWTDWYMNECRGGLDRCLEWIDWRVDV